MRESSAKRKPAPSGIVAGSHRDLRAEMLRRLDEENPEFVHVYQSPDIFSSKTKEWEMKVKGQEVVKDERGEVLHHMGDPIVRMKRSDFDAERAAEAEASRAAVESVVKPERSTVKRSPKSPPDAEEA